MRSALETLPWVAKGSVQADVSRQRVRFAITDKDEFDIEAIRRVLDEQGFRVGKVIAGP